MAYNFDATKEAMNEKEQAQGNIFGQQASPGGEQAGATQPASEGDGAIQSGGGAGASGGNAPAQQAAAPAGISGAKAFRANAGKQASPVNLQSLGENIKSAGQNLQNEANSYVQQAGAKDYGLSSEKLQAAVKGDQGEQARIGGILTRGTPDELQAFKPTTSTDIQGLSGISSDPALKGLLRRQGGPTYSGGEAAFDLGLLRQNKEFQTTRDELMRQNQALQKQREGLTAPTMDQARTASAGAYQQQSDAAKKQLVDMQDAIVAEEQGKRDVEVGKRFAPGNFEKYRSDAAENARAELMKDPANAALLPYLNVINQAQVDPNQYAKQNIRPEDVTSSQFVSPEEAQQFNNIRAMLGGGGEMQIAATEPYGGEYSFDTGGYKSSLNQLAQDMAGREKKRQDEFAVTQAQKAATKEQQNAYKAWKQQWIEKNGDNLFGMGAEDVPAEYRQFWDADQKAAKKFVNKPQPAPGKVDYGPELGSTPYHEPGMSAPPGAQPGAPPQTADDLSQVFKKGIPGSRRDRFI